VYHAQGLGHHSPLADYARETGEEVLMLRLMAAFFAGIALGLILCGTGHAAVYPVDGLKEPVYPPYCWVQLPNSELWYPCDSKEVREQNCLRLMERAMKAIDPFVPSLEHANMLPIMDDPEQYQNLLKLWNRVKQECWSELKDAPSQHYH